jgi:fatty-acyl-CoA synthase
MASRQLSHSDQDSRQSQAQSGGEAAVIGIPDEKWQERPLVAVVTKPDHHVTVTELRESLAGKIAGWQLLENWSFIEEVTKTSVGKFDKKQLRARYSNNERDIHRVK